MLDNKSNLNFKSRKVHFIGIGGIGMSALARYFHAKGSTISGSDKECSGLISDLQKEGIENIYTPHSRQSIERINPDYVIYTTALSTSNEELVWAKENKKNILHRADLLEYTTNSKKLISISGTHGKTTTSAMICEMLISSNFDPSAILGGILLSRNTNTIIGNGDYFVVEADESDKSFLKGNPEIAVITNIEPDHLENYPGGLEEIKKTFLVFAKKSISKKGLVFCMHDKNTREIVTNNFDLNAENLISYGIYPKYDSKVSARYNSKTKLWDVYFKGEFVNSIQFKNAAEHNILNSLAAYSVGRLVGLNPGKIKQSIESYQGVKRRFQTLAKINEITIIDDYAHHPTEIAATIQAAKELMPERLIAILQPHQPIRLKDLWSDFIKVLKQVENPMFITDTYLARGMTIEGVSSQKLVQEINKPNINYLRGNIDEIAKQVEKLIKPGDLILIMGAGDITNLGTKLIKSFQILASKPGNN